MTAAWGGGLLLAGIAVAAGIALEAAAGVPFAAAALLLWGTAAWRSARFWRWHLRDLRIRRTARRAWLRHDGEILSGDLSPKAWKRAGQWRKESAR